jgi:hypothetical protein
MGNNVVSQCRFKRYSVVNKKKQWGGGRIDLEKIPLPPPLQRHKKPYHARQLNIATPAVGTCAELSIYFKYCVALYGFVSLQTRQTESWPPYLEVDLSAWKEANRNASADISNNQWCKRRHLSSSSHGASTEISRKRKKNVCKCGHCKHHWWA